MSNPYRAGPPVYGEHFYNRARDIEKVLDTDIKLILFIATRRMGKTSLCYQIQHKCNPGSGAKEYKSDDKDYKSNICVIWNLQGKRDIPTAKRRLLSSTNRKLLEQVDWNQLKSLDSCSEVIKAFCETYWKKPDKKKIVLLVDEPETFLHFADKGDYNFLIDLKDTFEEIPNLRVVIVSPPRIQDLFLCQEVPCLLEDFQSEFLREFNDQEATNIIQLSERTEPVIKEIIEVSNRVPFYIQYICHEIVEAPPAQEPSQVIENIVERQVFSRFFTSDFNELHPIHKIMLLKLVQSKKPQESKFLLNETSQIASKIKEQSPTQKYIDDLFALGILKKLRIDKGEDKYRVSNKLFETWIIRDFDNLWNQTMKECEEDIQ